MNFNDRLPGNLRAPRERLGPRHSFDTAICIFARLSCQPEVEGQLMFTRDASGLNGCHRPIILPTHHECPISNDTGIQLWSSYQLQLPPPANTWSSKGKWEVSTTHYTAQYCINKHSSQRGNRMNATIRLRVSEVRPSLVWVDMRVNGQRRRFWRNSWDAKW